MWVARFPLLIVLLLAASPSSSQIGPLPGMGPIILGGCTAWVSAFSQTLNLNDTNGVITIARRIPITLTAGGNQLRATLNSATTAGVVSPTSSVGVAATPPSMSTNPPVQLFYSGNANFTLGSSSSIVTDPAKLVVSNGTQIVFDFDSTTENWRYAAGTSYYKIGAADYNTSSVSGYTTGISSDAISLVEVRTCP